MAPDHHARREIIGSRPSLLKINKDSHLIQKQSSLSSSLASSAASSIVSTAAAPIKQQRQPVIIYTHSPKIIHAKARDFMALVQKLTGMVPSDELAVPMQPCHILEGGNDRPEENNSDTTSSSVITEENCVGGDLQGSSSVVSPIFHPPNPFFSEIPLFTPNSPEFYSAQRAFYRYTDPTLSSQYGELDFSFQ